LNNVADTSLAVLEKTAGAGGLVPDPFERGANTLAGLWLAYALLTGGAAGKASYDFFRKRDNAAVTEEALRRRAQQRAGGQLPLYTVPTPMKT